MLPTDPASETPPALRPISWHDHGDYVWARLLCTTCGAARVYPFGPRFILAATPFQGAFEIARREMRAILGEASIEHHRPHLDAVATLAASAACRRMALDAIGPKPADAGPFVVQLCEGQTHFNGYPQWRGRDDTTIELMVPGDDPNPLGSLTHRLRGTRADGHAAEIARRALAWRTWRLAVPGE